MRSSLIRHAKDVLELHPAQQNWAGEVITVLREVAAAVTQATTDEHDQPDPQLLADLRQRYDHAVAWGITPTATAVRRAGLARCRRQMHGQR